MPNPPAQVDVSVLRPDDLLNLEIAGVNLRLDQADPKAPALVVDDPAQPALLVVTFPPQTIFEEAFFDSTPNPPPQTPRAGPAPAPTHQPRSRPHQARRHRRTPARCSSGSAARPGWSSRCRPMPGSPTRSPACSTGRPSSWRSRRSRTCPAGATPATEPADPGAGGHRDHPAAAVPAAPVPDPRRRLAARPGRPSSHGGRVELWHTRLATRDADGAAQPLSADNQIGLRAIWSPDYQPGGPVPSPGPTQACRRCRRSRRWTSPTGTRSSS